MAPYEIKKPITGNELKHVPFSDHEFVRFLKEKKLYNAVLKRVRQTNEAYYNETLRHDSLLKYFKNRSYIVRLFPWDEFCDWSHLMDEWVNTKKEM